jgi:RNA polymerase sigma-70 factor (ECF subfamily)
MDTDQLADLIGRAQRRRPEAFDELIDAYSSRLYGYFYRCTRSRHDAEDLLQEVFVRLVRMISEYQHDGRFDAWLFRIAANLVRDRARRARTSRQVGTAVDEQGREWLADVPDDDADAPSARLERGEQIDRMQQALGELPELEREVILLRHFSQLPFREIAEIMGTPLGTALARAHRGLAKLRELMTDEEG